MSNTLQKSLYYYIIEFNIDKYLVLSLVILVYLIYGFIYKQSTCPEHR